MTDSVIKPVSDRFSHVRRVRAKILYFRRLAWARFGLLRDS
jgi:hypothetical protein